MSHHLTISLVRHTFIKNCRKLKGHDVYASIFSATMFFWWVTNLTHNYFYIICLFESSTCFEQLCAHTQEET